MRKSTPEEIERTRLRHSSPNRWCIKYPMTQKQCDNTVKVLSKLCSDVWQGMNWIYLIIDNEDQKKAIEDRMSTNPDIKLSRFLMFL